MDISEVVPEDQPILVEIMDDGTVRIYLGDVGIVFPDIGEVRKLGERFIQLADAREGGTL